MTRLVIIIGTLCFALGIGAGVWLEHKPAPSVAVRAAQRESRAAAKVVVQRETTYVHDTAHAVRWLARYDTARVTDTVTHDSIVYVPRDVADSVVRACRDVLNSCAALHAADSAEIHALHGEIAARDADRPSRLRSILTGAGLVAGGYVLGRAGVGAGLSLRVPF